MRRFHRVKKWLWKIGIWRAMLKLNASLHPAAYVINAMHIHHLRLSASALLPILHSRSPSSLPIFVSHRLTIFSTSFAIPVPLFLPLQIQLRVYQSFRWFPLWLLPLLKIRWKSWELKSLNPLPNKWVYGNLLGATFRRILSLLLLLLLLHFLAAEYLIT